MNETTAPVPSDEAPHLLVVDDDSRIRTLISRFLAEHGFRVTIAASAAEARKKLAIIDFDLLVLDVMMPGESGMEFTADLRRSSAVPILMLTARSETESRIRGLELGADDYLAKPFDPRELLLRINNILKRGTVAPPKAKAGEIRFGAFVWDVDRDELRRDDDVVRLTDSELRLMRMFAERPGETIARHEIVQGESALGDRTADVQINRLRRKIETDPANPLHLVTVRGQGYRLKTDQAGG
ncbi:MAG: response regulator transcription factor [Siculibacillus sp.]|nr:response regulator transcription factor [Siculibacillus sp.]